MIRTLVGLSSLMVLLGACRSRSAGASPEECAPMTGPLPATASAEGLAGTYRLRLVATYGARKDAVADGTLWLQPQDSALRYPTRPGANPAAAVSHPLFGALDIDLGSVGAISVGDIRSRDPLQPGVLVIERHATPEKDPIAEITLRLGSDANRRDRTRVDGGYTALHVRQVSPGRLAGTWGSGVTLQRSAGYFCAVRKDGKDGKGGKDGSGEGREGSEGSKAGGQ